MQHTLNRQLWDVQGNAFVIAAVFLGKTNTVKLMQADAFQIFRITAKKRSDTQLESSGRLLFFMLMAFEGG